MIGKDGLKLLKWMSKHDKWLYFQEIEKSCGFPVEYRLVESLYRNKFLDNYVPPDAIPKDLDYDIPEIQYRINDSGQAYINAVHSELWKEFRNWAGLFIALAAFIKSFFF